MRRSPCAGFMGYKAIKQKIRHGVLHSRTLRDCYPGNLCSTDMNNAEGGIDRREHRV
jgi:hypothetical protein